MRLDGAVALVTGAGSGIGRALAVELSRHGARIVLLGRTVDALEETRARLAVPYTGMILPLDLADPAARAAIGDKVAVLTDGWLDLLVNNAGVVRAAPFEDQDEADWRAMFEVNVLAPMAITRALLPMLAASGQGRVANVGSMFGDIAFPFFAAYSAGKFALRGFSEALRRELSGHGVGVTYCAPRGVRTPAADGFKHYVDAFAMRLDAPERVARHLVRAIERDARDVYPRGPERLFVLVQRLAPGLVDNGLKKQVAAENDRRAFRLGSATSSTVTMAAERPLESKKG